MNNSSNLGPSLLLALAAVLGAPGCSPNGVAIGPCSADEECGGGAYCVQSQCVPRCRSDEDCAGPQVCSPHPDLPSLVSACFVPVDDPTNALPPVGDRNQGQGAGSSDIQGGLDGPGTGRAGGGMGGSAPFACEGDGLGGQGSEVTEVTGPDSVFVEGGLGISGSWQGYFHSFSAPQSEVYPDCFSTEQVCVQGTLSESLDQWVNVGWNIAQDIDPVTFEGGDVRAISPGGDGVRVEAANLGGSGLRVQIQTDPEATEFWCAPLPPSGSGVIRWEEFRKECWFGGGEQYDGVTPIAQIVVQSFAGSTVVPTPFHYCLIDIAPYEEP